MKNNNKIGQELSEFKPVELVGCEDEETGSSDASASWVVHKDNYRERDCEIFLKRKGVI